MPIPDEVVAGDSGHIQDHNDIAGVLTEHESAISTKANVNSPTFTGTPSAPTAAVDTNTTQIATTAFVVGQGYAKSSDLASIYLPLSGGTLTGTISGTDGSFSGTVSAADPTLDSHLTTKFYVDDAISTVSGGSFQNLTFGDFLTGTSSTYNGLTAVTVDVDGDSLNTPSTLVARDVSGNFSAGVITGSLSGNASTASALETSRTISLGGQLSGSASFDGSTNITITGSVSGVENTDLVNDSVTVTAGTGLSGGGIVALGSSISIDNDGILSVSGTTNEITASTVSGAVTLGLPSDITVSGNITAADPTLDTHLATKSYVDANAGGSVSRSINTQSSNYTLAASDAENIVTFSAAATVTIPPESSVSFSDATKVALFQTAGNTISIGAGSGVTIVNRGDFGTSTASEWSEVELLKIGADTWAILGDFNATAGRALFFSGLYINSIDYITMNTTGNATSFGNFSYTSPNGVSALSSSTRALVAGGQNSNVYYSNIQYVTISTTGNASNFGNMTVPRYSGAGLSSDTRGLFLGGYENSGGSGAQNSEYVTIATTGNGTLFGSILQIRTQFGAAASPTRGVFTGGGYQSYDTSIEYLTIATTGNSVSFGQNGGINFGTTGSSSSTRALFTREAAIDYITIATTGNSTLFGNLTAGRNYGSGTAGRTASFIGGGGSVTNTIDRTFIATLGNSTLFGNLTTNRYWGAAASNAHGGIAE